MVEEKKLSLPENIRATPLEILAHPVTGVKCDEFGAVYYTRKDEVDLVLGGGEPGPSRKEAAQRAHGILARFKGDETDLERRLPISASGNGLTYNQLRDQTIIACRQSKDIDLHRKAKFEAKKKKYNIK